MSALHGTPPWTFDHFIAHVQAWQEEFRHQCEVRSLLQKMRLYGRRYVQDYLNSAPVAKRRARLVQDLNAAMAAQRKEKAA